MIETITFEAPAKGPRLLVFGATHGNEHCGPAAIARILGDIRAGEVPVNQGRVTFVPVANPKAFSLKKRFVEANLNRAVRHYHQPERYEHKLMNTLCAHLENCDYFLNLHSYTAGGPPFAIVGDEKEEGFIGCLGADMLLYDWRSAYKNSGYADETSLSQIEYARTRGAIATTLECGQHDDPRAPEVAYQGIRNAMAFCGMTGESDRALAKTFARVTLTSVQYKGQGETLVKDWKHMEPVRLGDPLFTRADGSVQCANHDGVMVMPFPACPVGEEWFYTGVTRVKAGAMAPR